VIDTAAGVRAEELRRAALPSICASLDHPGFWSIAELQALDEACSPVADRVAQPEEWARGRTQLVGASEAFDLVSPQGSPFALYARKRGLTEPEDLSGIEAVRWGNRLEGPIREAFREESGRRVWTFGGTDGSLLLRSTAHPHLGASPDGAQRSEHRPDWGLVEIKAVGSHASADWEEEPPLRYQVQLQAQMLVTGARWGSLVALIGGQRLVRFDLDARPDFHAFLAERITAFWKAVADGSPPAPDASPAARRALAAIYPRDDGLSAFLPPEANAWSERREALRAEVKSREEEIDALTAQLTAAIGPASLGLLTDGGGYSYKATAGRVRYRCEACGHAPPGADYRSLRVLTEKQDRAARGRRG
jgi:putative phage-type endonuclease